MPANTNSWVNLGLNTHPTFFGCDTNARPNTTTPIVVYIPNYPWSTFSNVSTYQLEWEQNQVDSVFMNGPFARLACAHTAESDLQRFPQPSAPLRSTILLTAGQPALLVHLPTVPSPAVVRSAARLAAIASAAGAGTVLSVRRQEAAVFC